MYNILSHTYVYLFIWCHIMVETFRNCVYCARNACAHLFPSILMCGVNNIAEMIPTLSAACYSVRSAVCFRNSNTLKSIYYAYFHCYKIWNNFWVNSSKSGRIFTLQKKMEFWLVHNPETLTEVRLTFRNLASYI